MKLFFFILLQVTTYRYTNYEDVAIHPATLATQRDIIKL